MIDDDARLAEMLVEYLAPEGIELTAVATGIQGLRNAQRENYDLIILDVMLPGLSGFDVLKQLREAGSRTPVLMLTARGDDVDRIVGLDLGADDYLPKPFNPRELLARIKAVMRRAAGLPASDPAERGKVLRFAGWTLDLGRRRLESPSGDAIELSTGEFELLVAFAERPQRVLNRDQLLTLARGRAAVPFDRSIDVQVSRLRRKIESDPKSPQIITTVRGGGYVFTPTVERA